jgi:hypothetical protein
MVKTEEKVKKEEKNYSICCELCLMPVVEGALHCWELVNYGGAVGYVGCHEFFDSVDAYRLHVAKTGGCHAPENIDKLRWSGVSWEVKEEDDRRRRPKDQEV